jgi:hypothetical protein
MIIGFFKSTTRPISQKMGKLLIAYLNRRAAAYRRPFAAIDGPHLAVCRPMRTAGPPEAGFDPMLPDATRQLAGYQLGGAIALTRFHTSSGMLFFQTTPSIRLNAGLERAHASTRSMILAPWWTSKSSVGPASTFDRI